jgi:hypothetical protein
MSEVLRRYTELPFLLSLLDKRQLTLLSPNTWDDRNDSKFLRRYKRQKGLKSILVCCLTEASSTYHHWKVFSSGSSGVCIKFDRNKFISWADLYGLKHGPVIYRSIRKATKKTPTVDEIPFLKRHAFKDEKEYRVILEYQEKEVLSESIDFELTTISEIVINPWLHPSVYPSVEKAIRRFLHDNESIKIRQTTLLQNPTWEQIGLQTL